MKRDLPPDPMLMQALEAETALGHAHDARHRGDLALALEHALAAHAVAPLGELRAAAGWLAAFCLHRLGQHQALLALGRGLLALPLPPDRRCELMRWLCLACAETSHFTLARQLAAQAMALADSRGDTDTLAALQQTLAQCFERMGDPWRAAGLLTDSLPHAEQQPVLAPLLASLQQLAACALDEHHLLPDTGPALARDDPWPPAPAPTAGPTATDADALGRAQAYAQRARAVAERVGDQHFRGLLDGLLGEALLHQGRLDEAWPLLERALCLAQAHDLHALAWRCSCSLAEGLLQRGDARAAHARFSGLLAEGGEHLPHTLQHRLQLGLAAACRAQNQPERALLHRQQAERLRALRSVWLGEPAADAPAMAAAALSATASTTTATGALAPLARPAAVSVPRDEDTADAKGAASDA